MMSNADSGTEQQMPPGVDDALDCPMDQVGSVPDEDQSSVYNQFLNIMQEFKSQSLDTVGVITKIAALFRDNDRSLLADILVQYDIETNIFKQDRELFITIAKSIIESGLLPVSLAVERFELETNQKLGIDHNQKTYIVLRTRLYYKQKKYNLLREENEGFAKIIAELYHLPNGDPKRILHNVINIIGRYRVDPNRVLDLYLEVFEFCCLRNYSTLIEFLKIFYDSPDKVLQIIALKISFHGNLNDDATALNTEGLPRIPGSLYRLIAVLIHECILEIDEVYTYLAPEDAKILDYHKKLVEEGRAHSRRYAMAVVGDEKPVVSIRDSLSDRERHILELDNQKIYVCAHLIDIGGWDQAVQLSKRLPEYFCFSHERVASTACDLINYLIDPLYRGSNPLPTPLNSRIKIIPERSDGPPQITSIEDMEKRLLPMLMTLGPFLSYNTLVFTKIIRLLRHVLTRKQIEGDEDIITLETPLYLSIIDVMGESILPALSLSGSNCCLAREVWSLLKIFKYSIRYKLYFSCRDEGSNPTLLRNRGQILLRAKHYMKRLSKETLRLSGRHLGKLCCSNPVITLNYMLLQVQSFDNLISMVVDSLRFMTPLAIDALIYCIIETLSDPRKQKKSHDGMAISSWLTNLSSFSATVIARYKVEITAFLEYIAHQLKAGSSLDLVLLTDLIQKMTGIETIQAITDDRIEALMGGDLLRTEGAYFNQVKNTRKSSARLKDALMESGLAMPLCISIAQVRDSLFFDQQEDNPLKLVGKLYDQCQETFVQYGVFLAMNLKIDDYMNFLPPLDKLMMDYKFDPDSAFFLARPMIFHKIQSKFLELKEAAAMEVTIEEGEAPEISFQTSGLKFIEAAKSVIDPLAKAIQPSLAEKYGTNNLNCKLFVIFWTLSMSNIEVPVDCYAREISRLRKAVDELNPKDDDFKKRKEVERCNSLIQRLKQEQAEQLEHTSYIKMYLESERSNLFRERSNFDHVYLESRQFVQHCPYSRSILTAYDAIYSARFLLFLHELKVEDYPTIICFDRLLCDITYMMGACTENEANHYGRFLCQILKITALWHSDSKIYNEQCEKYPGSIINVENAEHITYENFRDICYKWHYRLTRAFTVALESNNYVLIRNALIVMISIIEYYPAIKHFGKGIGMKIEEVRNSEKEKRQDLYALATAYAGKLDEKKPTLIPEANFHTVDDRTPNSHRERHSSSSSRKKARHS